MTPSSLCGGGGGGSRPPQSTASAAQRGTKFGLVDGDADDFYDVVMSSEDEDDASDGDDGEGDRAAETARNTARNASQPRDEAEQLAALSLNDTAAATTSAAVMRRIGSISYSAASADRSGAAKPSTIQSGDDEFVLTEEELQSHTQRRSALEIALDAATRSLPPDANAGEAPFRFASARGKPVTSPAPGSSITPSAGHAPQQSESAKRKPGLPLGGVNELDSDDEELSTEPDPLYDDAMDDADEKWVQTNLRGDGAPGTKTDATLCCPCCFVTVCMDCQRHVKYINQYRARAAMNCRVKKDEILTYAASGAAAGPSRQQLNAMTKRQASGAAALLGKDEYFGVVCSDCGTTVGVYDAHQDYHFFNILPSTC